MEPISRAAIATQVASQVADGVSGYRQGKYEAAIAGQNAQLAKENARRARFDAGLAEEAKRFEIRQSLGRSAAAAAQSGAAGGGPGQGSFGLLLSQSARQGELDALNIRHEGAMAAYGHQIEAAQFEAEQRAAKRRAKGAALKSLFGSATAALSGYADYRRDSAARAAIDAQRAPRKNTAPRLYKTGG